MLEYSKKYAADHWCEKGHIVHMLFGELIIEYKDSPAHKVRSDDGATALIIDYSLLNISPHLSSPISAFVTLLHVKAYR